MIDPKKEDTAKANHRQASRIGKHLLSGHFETETILALRELLLDESRAKDGERVTVQSAIARGLELFFEERGANPPAELSHVAAKPPNSDGRGNKYVHRGFSPT